MANPTTNATRHMHIRHMIVGLAVLSLGAHGLIIAAIVFAGWMARCT